MADWCCPLNKSAKPLQVGFLYPGPQAAALSPIKAAQTGLHAGGQDQVTIIPALTGSDATLLAPLAADLVARKVDLIFAQSGAAVRAAQAATSTIPIVDLECDPIASGFISAKAKPGGNMTGVFLDFADFSTKWLEALKETIPKLSRLAVFWDPAMASLQLHATEAAARCLISSSKCSRCRVWPTSSLHYGLLPTRTPKPCYCWPLPSLVTTPGSRSPSSPTLRGKEISWPMVPISSARVPTRRACCQDPAGLKSS
jgi:ABC transporter substrate binding protein